MSGARKRKFASELGQSARLKVLKPEQGAERQRREEQEQRDQPHGIGFLLRLGAHSLAPLAGPLDVSATPPVRHCLLARFLGPLERLGIHLLDPRPAIDGPARGLVRVLVERLLDDANAEIAAALVHALRLVHRQTAVVEDGIDVPSAALIDMYLERAHHRPNAASVMPVDIDMVSGPSDDSAVRRTEEEAQRGPLLTHGQDDASIEDA